MKSACLYVSKRGPDRVWAAICTSVNITLPTILFGCEFWPFTETKLKLLDQVQSQDANIILGVTCSTANLCAQGELGWKPFKQLVLEKQLTFYSSDEYGFREIGEEGTHGPCQWLGEFIPQVIDQYL